MRANYCVEPLETRTLLGVHLPWTWRIEGTPEADTIVVAADASDHRMISASVNGAVVATRRARSLGRIVVSGGDGADTISIDLGGHARIRVVVRGDAGDDTLTSADGRGKL